MPRAEKTPPERAAGVKLRAVALLGKRDEPTDGVRDYCACLGEALSHCGVAMEAVEVRWDRQGRLAALARLWKQSADWRGRWVLLQYTALMWSGRGFPFIVPAILWMMKLRGCRTAVVFHDVYTFPGRRWIDRVRIDFQIRIMRHVCRRVERAIFPVPVEQVPWLFSRPANASFIPIGANIPSLDDLDQLGARPEHTAPLAVAVFSLSEWPSAQKQEIEHIAEAMLQASATLGPLRLFMLGRGTKEAEPALRQALAGSRVEMTVDGLLKSGEITARLCACDALLFVRGPLTSRRGSGLAGIACGLPVVAYEGLETGAPLRDAGILFVPKDDVAALAEQLIRVLQDETLRRTLAARSIATFRQWFAWDRIAERFTEVLGG